MGTIQLEDCCAICYEGTLGVEALWKWGPARRLSSNVFEAKCDINGSSGFEVQF